ADRTGELAMVSYVLADCIMRLAPTKADDALEARRLEEQLNAAVELLEGFAGGNPASPQAPDALLKLGLCHQRLAALMVQPPVAPMALLNLATLLRGQNKAAEAADVLAQARQAHEANLQKDPARAGWVFLLQYHQGVALREANKRPEARAVLNLVVQNAAGKV